MVDLTNKSFQQPLIRYCCRQSMLSGSCAGNSYFSLIVLERLKQPLTRVKMTESSDRRVMFCEAAALLMWRICRPSQIRKTRLTLLCRDVHTLCFMLMYRFTLMQFRLKVTLPHQRGFLLFFFKLNLFKKYIDFFWYQKSWCGFSFPCTYWLFSILLLKMESSIPRKSKKDYFLWKLAKSRNKKQN